MPPREYHQGPEGLPENSSGRQPGVPPQAAKPRQGRQNMHRVKSLPPLRGMVVGRFSGGFRPRLLSGRPSGPIPNLTLHYGLRTITPFTGGIIPLHSIQPPATAIRTLRVRVNDPGTDKRSDGDFLRRTYPLKTARSRKFWLPDSTPAPLPAYSPRHAPSAAGGCRRSRSFAGGGR